MKREYEELYSKIKKDVYFATIVLMITITYYLKPVSKVMGVFSLILLCVFLIDFVRIK